MSTWDFWALLFLLGLLTRCVESWPSRAGHTQDMPDMPSGHCDRYPNHPECKKVPPKKPKDKS